MRLKYFSDYIELLVSIICIMTIVFLMIYLLINWKVLLTIWFITIIYLIVLYFSYGAEKY